MKNILLILFIINIALLDAALNDYQDEFGFPLDKPRHGRYFFQRELLSIDQDPQIMTYLPAADDLLRTDLVDNSLETELDRFSLSDTTLVIDTDALNDLDLFSNLKLDSGLGEYNRVDESDTDYSFKSAEPADYNLYIKMQIPDLTRKNLNEINFIPVTSQTKQELKHIIPLIMNLSYQIDNIYTQENMIIPQNGSIDFIITISPEGITAVDCKTTAGSVFSRGFITKCQDTIRRWQITSSVKVQYILSRNYLLRP